MKGETITYIDDYTSAKTDKVPPVIKSVKASNHEISVDDLFRDHHETVYLAAYRVSGKTQDAEDVLQSVFLRLLKRPEPFINIGDDPRRYLCRAAINASFDISRSKKNKPLVSLDEKQHKLEVTQVLSTQGSSIDKDVRQAEQRKQLRAALLQLNSRAAEIFALRYFEEFTNAEIAEIMQSSVTSIGVELHRARGRLRELLSELED